MKIYTFYIKTEFSTDQPERPHKTLLLTEGMVPSANVGKSWRSRRGYDS